MKSVSFSFDDISRLLIFLLVSISAIVKLRKKMY